MHERAFHGLVQRLITRGFGFWVLGLRLGVHVIIYHLLTKLADALATSRAAGAWALRRTLTGTSFRSALGLFEVRKAREARCDDDLWRVV